MFSSVVGLSSRRIVRQTWQRVSARRFLSTPSTASRRTWKGAAVRWSLAAAAIYYYNTSSVFAEENEDDVAINQFGYSIAPHVADSTPSTIDAIVQEKRKRQALQLTEEQVRRKADADVEAELTATRESRADSASENIEAHSDLESDEVDASQAGAFNPETGEINWDCPCLGGMAHGPCGENFKAAFSCFVYSKEEPKGVDCIEKFKDMQDCFRQHPDLYGAELDDQDDMPPDKSTDDGPDDIPNKSINAEALSAEPLLASHDNAPSAPLPPLATESPVAANPNPSPNSNPSPASLSDPPSEPHDVTRSSG